jgi:hypothetical protein
MNVGYDAFSKIGLQILKSLTKKATNPATPTVCRVSEVWCSASCGKNQVRTRLLDKPP